MQRIRFCTVTNRSSGVWATTSVCMSVAQTDGTEESGRSVFLDEGRVGGRGLLLDSEHLHQWTSVFLGGRDRISPCQERLPYAAR